MYKVLIADDDLLVRMDLISLIDWNSYGMELTDAATNGSEALEMILQQNPQIVILDLEMPLMNGLEVLKKLKEEKYSNKVIVLSCHDDFDNVSEALKLGAADYLLKHTMRAQNLIASLQKVIEMYETENQEKLNRQKMEKLSEISLRVIRENYVKDLISGSLKVKEQVEETLKKLNIDTRLEKFLVVLIELDEFYKLKEKSTKAELNSLLKSFGDILDTVLKGNGYIHGVTKEGEYCVILDFERKKSFMSINTRTFELCEKIVSSIKSYLNLAVSIGLSRVCEDYRAVDECYMQSRLALDGKFYLGGNKVIHFSEVEKYNGKMENFLAEYEIEMLDIIKEENKINDFINKIFNILKANPIKPENKRTISFELLMFSNKIIKEYSLGYNEVFGFDYLPYNYVMSMETLANIQEWFISVCHNMSKAVAKYSRRTELAGVRLEIKKAIEYIHSNYIKNISLQEIADYSNLSRTYFSQLFKQETGENFIDYLNRYRIENAKKLLKNTDSKVYSIGMDCGFENYRYFTKLFKEICGMSPIEYREEDNMES